MEQDQSRKGGTCKSKFDIVFKTCQNINEFNEIVDLKASLPFYKLFNDSSQRLMFSDRLFKDDLTFWLAGKITNVTKN